MFQILGKFCLVQPLPMSSPLIIHPVIAQTPVPPASNTGQLWMFSSAGLLVLSIGLAVYGKLQLDGMAKKMKLERR